MTEKLEITIKDNPDKEYGYLFVSEKLKKGFWTNRAGAEIIYNYFNGCPTGFYPKSGITKEMLNWAENELKKVNSINRED